MPRNGTSFEEKAEWMRERQSAPPLPVSSSLSFAERHYSIAEVAAVWQLSPDAVRRIFQNEPGVLILGGQRPPHKRKYTTLRVPESVLLRVHRRMTKA
jgi:hypothetical protein